MHAFRALKTKSGFLVSPPFKVRSLDPRGAHPSAQESGPPELFVSGPNRATNRRFAARLRNSSSAHKINRTLAARSVRCAPGEESAVLCRSIVAVGDSIVVREGQSASGILYGPICFWLWKSSISGGDSSRHRQAQYRGGAESPADEHFAKAFVLEESDVDAARSHYEACLAVDPHHPEARLNLGRLLHLGGRLRDAEQVYRGAGATVPSLSTSRCFSRTSSGSRRRCWHTEMHSLLIPASPTRISILRGSTSAQASPRTRYAICSHTGA